MKLSTHFSLSLLCGIFTLLAFNHCTNPKEDLCNPTPTFNIDRFIEEVQMRMNDPANPVSGYQFVVNQDGNLYHEEADGVSVHANDPNGPIEMTTSTRMNVASVSKFIGAMALMKAMEEKGLSVEFNVIYSLPDSWQAAAHPDFTDVDSDAFLTFRRLLRMETAIDFPGSNPSPGDMLTESQMLAGLSAPPDLNRIGVYQNGNFTLIRVLIGELIYELDETDPNYNTTCTDKYFEYIKTNFFDPLEIYPPMSAQSIEDYYDVTVYTLGYQFPFDPTWVNPTNGSLGWAHYSNPYLNGGSGGLILSSLDIAKLVAYFRHDVNETIISAVQRDKILSYELGLIESADGEYGRYQSKGGTRGPENCCDRALRSRVMFFPNGVEAVLLTNCNQSAIGTILKDSFDAAWESC